MNNYVLRLKSIEIGVQCSEQMQFTPCFFITLLKNFLHDIGTNAFPQIFYCKDCRRFSNFHNALIISELLHNKLSR